MFLLHPNGSDLGEKMLLVELEHFWGKRHIYVVVTVPPRLKESKLSDGSYFLKLS